MSYSRRSSEVKSIFAEACDVECEPLTFGELRVGDKFIGFPWPGDNQGHGGLLGTFPIFVKTAYVVGMSIGYMVGMSLGSSANAVRINDGHSSTFADDLFVIKVV